MNRRNFLLSVLAAGAGLVLTRYVMAGGDRGTSMIEKRSKTDKQWRAELSPEQFDVLRREGTEPAFSSPLNKEYGKGVYVCAGCALTLFESIHKFDSGTGWPSFTMPIEDHIETKRDFRMILPRTEYHCARCGGHQGHVFSDGPAPTGQRWCNNGVALQFVPS